MIYLSRLCCATILLSLVSADFVDVLQRALDNFKPHPDAHLSAVEIISKYGYPVETHHAITVDGYNLTLFRIPHGRRNSAAFKGPVFLQHGLQCSGNDWLLNAPHNTLPYLLADEGYDVFIGNARGSNYSANNDNRIDPSNIEYWNFSFHEMGVFDLPAVIDYILDVTSFEKVFYIGHSMGTTMFFVSMSERPEYNSKIRGMFAMAPIAYFGNSASPIIKLLAPMGIGNWYYKLQSRLGEGQLLPEVLTSAIQRMSPKFCRRKGRWMCNNLPMLLYGYDPTQVSNLKVSNIFGHSPSNTSVRSFSHYLQLYNQPGQFRMYNWGTLGNMREYRSFVPPSYDLKRITAPIYLFWGQNDILAHPKDVALLKSKLPAESVKLSKRVDNYIWNHQDFLYGKDAGKLVYSKIISNMNDIVSNCS